MHRKLNMNPTTTCSACMIYLNTKWFCHLKKPLADFNLRKYLKKNFIKLCLIQIQKIFCMWLMVYFSNLTFDMKKSFSIKINHICTTYYCRVHVEFSMHYDVYRYICCTWHINKIL